MSAKRAALLLAILFTIIFVKNIVANIAAVGELPKGRIVPLLQY